jgi:hypothetical protein
MTITPEERQELVKRLLEQYGEIRSWRKVAEQYPGVTFQTLNRIATSEGEWLPKERGVLVALGLIKPKPPRTRIQKAIDRMVRNMKKPDCYQEPDAPDQEKMWKKQ